MSRRTKKEKETLLRRKKETETFMSAKKKKFMVNERGMRSSKIERLMKEFEESITITSVDCQLYWQDVNGNRWSCDLFPNKSTVVRIAETMLDSGHCVNCNECVNCYKCNNCTQCTDCSDCVDCRRMTKCHNCHDSKGCNRCWSCDNCTDCTGQHDRKSCSNITDAY